MILGCWPTLDAQIVAAEAKIAQLLPDTPFAPLTTVPGWGMSGPPITAPRWATPVGGREPASSTAPPVCDRHNTSRPGSVVTAASAGRAAWALRRALMTSGSGCGHADPSASGYGQRLRARGKKGGVIGWAMANRANRIAFALVRDQTGYDPGRRAGPQGDSSIAATSAARRSGQFGAPAAQRGRTRLTATSSGAQSGTEEASERTTWHFTTSPAGETLDGTKGWTTRRSDYGGHLSVTPLLAWRPGLRQLRQPERRQLTRDHDHEVAYRQRGRPGTPKHLKTGDKSNRPSHHGPVTRAHTAA